MMGTRRWPEDADEEVERLEAKITNLLEGFAHALYESEHLDDAIMYSREHLGVISEDEYISLLGKENNNG